MVSPIFKEMLVMSPLILHHLAIGIVLAYPAVLNPALIGDATDVKATREEASWIAASFSMTGGIGFISLPPLMQLFGRRFINALINIIIFIGWIIIALSPDVPTIIAGRAFQGISFGGLYICSILAGEYAHPKRRGFFVVFKITATGVGELICHGFGFSLSWRLMAWLGAIPPAIAALATIAWPESPSWLAYKGRFDDCLSSLEWIRGKSPESKKEANELINAQQEFRSLKKMNKEKCLMLRILEEIKSKEFLKPFTVVLMLLILTQVCGRHYLLAYVVQIMISMTGDSSKAYYYTIGLDVMKIFAIIISSLIVRVYKRRALLILAGSLACFLLCLMCFLNFLVYKSILNVPWLTPLILIAYNIVCNIGVIPVSMVLKGELMPLKFKGLGTSVLGVFSSILSMVLLKSTPALLASLDTHGTFAVYVLIAISSLMCLFYILPETKDRTLQDIQSDFIDLPKYVKIDSLLVRNKIYLA